MIDIPAWELLRILLGVGDHAGVLPDVAELVHLLMLVTELVHVSEPTLVTARTFTLKVHENHNRSKMMS